MHEIKTWKGVSNWSLFNDGPTSTSRTESRVFATLWRPIALAHKTSESKDEIDGNLIKFDW